jgi:hypothetical protein
VRIFLKSFGYAQILGNKRLARYLRGFANATKTQRESRVVQVLIQAVDHSIEEFKRVAESYSETERAFLLIRQLNRLVKAVQRHRGISLALLAGNKSYRRELESLQVQLERRLATLEVFASETALLSDLDKQKLANAWVTIRSDWEDDNPNDNFELHSHLIEQLLAMIQGLSERLMEPVANDSGGAMEDHELLLKTKLVEFICSSLPALIEGAARIRGATSYMVAIGGEHGLDDTKIRFWINEVREQGLRVSKQAVILDERDSFKPFKRVSIKHTEVMLLKVLDVVDAIAFLGHASMAGSTNIFSLATEVIERYWAAVDGGLDGIQAWHLESLDLWMEQA